MILIDAKVCHYIRLMNVKTLTIIFILFSNLTFSQFLIQDLTNSEVPNSIVLAELVDKIQNGNAEDIVEYIEMALPPDFENFKMQSKIIEEKLKDKKLSSNDLKIISDNNSYYWIRRTIFKQKKSKQTPMYQIYIELKKSDDFFIISNVQIKQGKEIELFD